jgi:hypothetical protein
MYIIMILLYQLISLNAIVKGDNAKNESWLLRNAVAWTQAMLTARKSVTLQGWYQLAGSVQAKALPPPDGVAVSPRSLAPEIE